MKVDLPIGAFVLAAFANMLVACSGNPVEPTTMRVVVSATPTLATPTAAAAASSTATPQPWPTARMSNGLPGVLDQMSTFGKTPEEAAANAPFSNGNLIRLTINVDVEALPDVNFVLGNYIEFEGGKVVSLLEDGRIHIVDFPIDRVEELAKQRGVHSLGLLILPSLD